MQELVLTENYIGELPDSIGCLTRLNNLNVDRNRLEYVPPAIGNLVQVRFFFNDSKLEIFDTLRAPNIDKHCGPFYEFSQLDMRSGF